MSYVLHNDFTGDLWMITILEKHVNLDLGMIIKFVKVLAVSQES